MIEIKYWHGVLLQTTFSNDWYKMLCDAWSPVDNESPPLVKVIYWLGTNHPRKQWSVSHMMTSSNGSISSVTSPLCGEFTGHRWSPLTKTGDAELWCFLSICTWINNWVNNGEAGDLRRHRSHFVVTVMDADMGQQALICSELHVKSVLWLIFYGHVWL